MPAPCEAWHAPDAQASSASDGVELLIVILALVLVAVVVFVIGAPLRRARPPGGAGADALAPARHDRDGGTAPKSVQELVDELDTAREVKYREIRDAELDYRTGKLSRADYEAIDADLRAEALELLDRLERLRPTDA